jgi:ATP-dependent Lon protease
MNTKPKEIFRGKVVNKALTRNTGVDEFPRYVPAAQPNGASTRAL